MKKGFTLAEVLITFMIITAVFVMTLPALIKNVKDAYKPNNYGFVEYK